MEEKFEIQVTQTPGMIEWNYEALKNALAEKMKEYEKVVYTEDKVKDARADMATLRKLKKELDDKRKQIKNECLAPYEKIEAQAKELTALIDAPIKEIDKQVSEYEEKRKQEIRNEINAFMDETFKDIPAEIAEVLKNKTYDTKWENATATKKSWKEAIKLVGEITQKELSALEEIEDEFKEDVMKVYRRNLVLADALEKANELRKAKERILEAERLRREKEAQKAPEPVVEQKEEPKPEPAMSRPMPEFGKPWIGPDEKTLTLKITGTQEQLDKIQGFITHVKAKFVEVI